MTTAFVSVPSTALNMRLLRAAQVPWYSAMTTWWLFGLVVSLKILLGRFDRRQLQAALTKQRNRLHGVSFQQDKEFFYSDYSSLKELHVDFMADCGDGWVSSRAASAATPLCCLECFVLLPSVSILVTRLRECWRSQSFVLRPKCETRGRTTTSRCRGLVFCSLVETWRTCFGSFSCTFVRTQWLLWTLDRYPAPSAESYEQRLFRVFEDAMPPPRNYDPVRVPQGCYVDHARLGSCTCRDISFRCSAIFQSKSPRFREDAQTCRSMTGLCALPFRATTTGWTGWSASSGIFAAETGWVVGYFRRYG